MKKLPPFPPAVYVVIVAVAVTLFVIPILLWIFPINENPINKLFIYSTIALVFIVPTAYTCMAYFLQYQTDLLIKKKGRQFYRKCIILLGIVILAALGFASLPNCVQNGPPACENETLNLGTCAIGFYACKVSRKLLGLPNIGEISSIALIPVLTFLMLPLLAFLYVLVDKKNNP